MKRSRWIEEKLSSATLRDFAFAFFPVLAWTPEGFSAYGSASVVAPVTGSDWGQSIRLGAGGGCIAIPGIGTIPDIGAIPIIGGAANIF